MKYEYQTVALTKRKCQGCGSTFKAMPTSKATHCRELCRMLGYQWHGVQPEPRLELVTIKLLEPPKVKVHISNRAWPKRALLEPQDCEATDEL